MIDHVFLESGHIQEVDLAEILDLTAVGDLEWGRAGGSAAAIGTDVGRIVGQEVAERVNLTEIRAGYIPPESNPGRLNYVRLTDGEGTRHYIAEDVNVELLEVAQRVLDLGLLAVHTQSGRLSGEIRQCVSRTHDDRLSGHIQVHDLVHGILGTVMSGTERHICVQCCETTTAEMLR